MADSIVIREAIRGSLLEVRLGEIAHDKTDNDAVEDFADKMVEDHGAMQRRWAELARENGLQVETTLGPVREASVRRHQSLSGTEFDRAYMTTMIQDHERNVAGLQRIQTLARSSEVREQAASDLATVQEHLAAARELGNRIGVSPVAALPPDRTRTRRPAKPGDDQAADDRGGADRRSAADRTLNPRDDDDRRNLSATDRSFLREVLQDHVMELRLADRASRKAQNEKTRDFAEDLAKDFEKWLDRWEEAAERHDIAWEGNLGPLHQQKLERLAKANDNRFDRTYAAIVAENLGSIVPYFQKEGKAVQSEAVRRLVEDELPVIREYLAKARQLD